ncbi:MAG: SPFH domain-containing protein [Chitinophagales bacterium]
MAFWDLFVNEFIDIIEWLDSTNDTILYRFQRHRNEIKNGAKLIVRESQVAVFVEEGRIADLFSPGTHTLTTENLPILSTLRNWKHGFESPFKAEVYFINTKNFLDQKWGTKNPIMLRDPEFGPIRLRAFGTYAFKVTNAVKFIEEVAGTNGYFTTDELAKQLRNITISRFTDVLGESKIPILDLAASYDELGLYIQNRINPDFEVFGISLTQLAIENISLPPNVEAVLDKRSSMGILGDLKKYTEYQMAEAMTKAAENTSGGANEGIGMGMGMAMANQMMKQQTEIQQKIETEQIKAKEVAKKPEVTIEKTPAFQPPPLPAPLKIYVAQNGESTGPFDAESLKELIKAGKLTTSSLVWQKGMASWAVATEIEAVARFLENMPPPLPPLG